MMDSSKSHECAICIDVLGKGTPGTKPLQYLQCMHVFHRECISRALDVKKECPICRTSTIAETKSSLLHVQDEPTAQNDHWYRWETIDPNMIGYSYIRTVVFEFPEPTRNHLDVTSLVDTSSFTISNVRPSGSMFQSPSGSNARPTITKQCSARHVDRRSECLPIGLHRRRVTPYKSKIRRPQVPFVYCDTPIAHGPHRGEPCGRRCVPSVIGVPGVHGSHHCGLHKNVGRF